MIRIGVLGAARIAVTGLIPASKKSSRVQLWAVASRDPQKASSFAQQHGFTKSHLSYEALLADPEVDLVYVPLPNSEHAHWSIAALEAGKHVLCEKPFSLSAAEARKVAEVSQRSGKQVIEAFMYRFHPQFTVALDLIQAGAIGELRLIKSNFSFNLQRALDIRWDPALGGGVLYDVGCYCVSASRLFAGREAVQVWASADRTEQGVDYAFNAMMDFGPQPSGIRLRANFDASFRSGFYQRLELIGEGGNLLVAEPFLPDARFARRHGTHAPRLWLNGHELITEAADSYLLMLDDFAEAIAQASPARFPIGDTLRQMATLDALFAAAQSPQAQPIQTEVAP